MDNIVRTSGFWGSINLISFRIAKAFLYSFFLKYNDNRLLLAKTFYILLIKYNNTVGSNSKAFRRDLIL